MKVTTAPMQALPSLDEQENGCESGKLAWYAVHSKPHQEGVAESNLRLLGIETFCPYLKLKKFVRKKEKFSTSPLFPGYLFARFDLRVRLRAVLYGRGVKRIVGFGESPAVVEDGLVESIKTRIRDGYIDLPTVKFSPGQIVRIQDGPLKGLEAVFEREIPGYQRAILLLRALSYHPRVQLDFKDIVNL